MNTQNQTFKQPLLTFGARRSRGVTLMELIAAVAVMAILVVGALTLYNAASTGSNSTQMLRDVTGLQTATKSLYAGQSGYGTASLNDTLINFKAVPTSWSVNGTAITHSLNGAVEVTGDSAVFNVSLADLPKDVCIKLLSNASAGWSKYTVGSATGTFPVDPTSANTACSTDKNTVVMTSK